MEQIVIYLLTVQKFYKIKAKYSEIRSYSLCLGKISKDWTNDNIKKLDLMVTFFILVLIIRLLQLLIY